MDVRRALFAPLQWLAKAIEGLQRAARHGHGSPSPVDLADVLAPATPVVVFPAKPRGAVIIRTQGKRPGLLLEALSSVAMQTLPVTAFIVVHGDAGRRDGVQAAIRGIHDDVQLLHAPETGRCRGYPLNLALERIYAAGTGLDFLFFLDDDDIVYPEFSAAVAEVFRQPGADVVYAASQSRVPGKPAVPAYAPLPVACLLFENFIPINAYAVRIAAIRRARPLFDESLEVLEDWNFLHRLLAMPLNFVPVVRPLSEFRHTGDGNTPDKRDQAMWDRAWEGVHHYLDEFWRDADRDALLQAWRNFDFSARGPLTPAEARIVSATARLLERKFPGALPLTESQ